MCQKNQVLIVDRVDTVGDRLRVHLIQLSPDREPNHIDLGFGTKIRITDLHDPLNGWRLVATDEVPELGMLDLEREKDDVGPNKTLKTTRSW